MSGDRRRAVPWLRVFAEGTAILVSILLAFGIEAWWSDRAAAREEALFLAGLEVEIGEALEALDFADDYHNRVVDASYRWPELTPASHPDTIADLINRLTTFASPGVVLASADALLSAGRVANISDPAIRRWIGAWPARYAVFDRQLTAVDDFARFEVFRYFASRNLSFASIPRRGLRGEEGPIRDRALMRRLVDDPGLATLWAQGARMSAILVFDSGVLRGYLEEGRRVLRSSRAPGSGASGQ